MYQRTDVFIRVCSFRRRHDDAVTWKHCSHYWRFVKGIHQSLVVSPHKRLVMRGVDVSFADRLNKMMKKQSFSRWFETPRYSCNVTAMDSSTVTYVTMKKLHHRWSCWPPGAQTCKAIYRCCADRSHVYVNVSLNNDDFKYFSLVGRQYWNCASIHNWDPRSPVISRDIEGLLWREKNMHLETLIPYVIKKTKYPSGIKTEIVICIIPRIISLVVAVGNYD